MMPELTSLIAWESLIESGRLKGRQAETLRILGEHGPLTAQELQARTRTPGLWKRLSELKRKGCAEVIGLRACSVTLELSKVWAVKRIEPEPAPAPEPEPDSDPVQVTLFDYLRGSTR